MLYGPVMNLAREDPFLYQRGRILQSRVAAKWRRMRERDQGR
jgi:hypothetical protein